MREGSEGRGGKGWGIVKVRDGRKRGGRGWGKVVKIGKGWGEVV